MTNLAEDQIQFALELLDYLPTASFAQVYQLFTEAREHNLFSPIVKRILGANDRYYLLAEILGRQDMYQSGWIYERCRMVEADPNGYLDLWARGHYKTSIITQGGTFQRIINQPSITICILAESRTLSKRFINLVKLPCERNPVLHELWPDVFWSDPKNQASVWSEEKGLTMVGHAGTKEATVSAYSLEAQPTGAHYDLLIFNDIVTAESVTTPDMINKTTELWELAQNLGHVETAGKKTDRWHEGTRYHFADTYAKLIERKAVTERRFAATEDGTLTGTPVLLTPEAWERKKLDETPRTIACQQLLNPLAGQDRVFQEEWLRQYELRPETMNVYITVDPAGTKKKGACNTGISVIGMDHAFNKYLIDGYCHQMNLTERWERVKGLHRKWTRQPGVQAVRVGYEKYGMQSDLEHFQKMMEIEKYVFPIEEVSWPRELTLDTKRDRIERLVPDFQSGRFYLPYKGAETSLQARAVAEGQHYLVSKKIKQRNQDGELYDLTDYLVSEEYKFFPATTKVDLLDAMSRIYDMDPRPPIVYDDADCLPEWVGDD